MAEETIVTYDPVEHAFFDQLVVYLAAVASTALGSAAQREGTVAPFAPTDNVVMHGSADVSRLEMVFYPCEVFTEILDGGWPQSLEIRTRDLASGVPARFSRLSGTHRFNAVLIQQAFLQYFEHQRPQIESVYGRDRSRWPAVWNFGRVIRNGFAHGGSIHFRNRNARAVSWQTLSYGPGDNGRPIMFNPMTPLEVILLMGDMNRASRQQVEA